MNKTLRVTLIIILLFAGIAAGGIAMALYADTIVNPWTVVNIGAAAGIITSPLLHRSWSKLTQIDMAAANWAVNIIFVGLVTACAVLMLNKAGASDTAIETQAVIENKYTTKRTRGGRRHTRHTYTVYNISMRFATGTLKHREVPVDTYTRIRHGSSIPVEVRDGMLGWPIISPKFTRSKYKRPKR